MPILKYDSYINAGEMITFDQGHLASATLVYRLPETVKERIKSVVAKHNYLPPRYARLVFDNL